MSNERSRSNETDPRFPSGRWKGFFYQNGQATAMTLTFTFSDGQIEGAGHDAIGEFEMSGKYRLSDGRVLIFKHYLGAHTVDYSGVVTVEAGMRGIWYISTISGEFQLRPDR